MTMPELWGWVETLLVQLGVWDMLGAAISVIITVSLAFWVISRLSR